MCAGRLVGGVLAAMALGLVGSRLPALGSLTAQGLFYLIAGITVVSAGAAVSLRNPIYCAIWFAMTLLGTAGLFLLQGAQFLAVATVVVYAGAILVTFLFVLMLAEPSGRASYDRLSWEGLLSAVGGRRPDRRVDDGDWQHDSRRGGKFARECPKAKPDLAEGSVKPCPCDDLGPGDVRPQLDRRAGSRRSAAGRTDWGSCYCGR